MNDYVLLVDDVESGPELVWYTLYEEEQTFKMQVVWSPRVWLIEFVSEVFPPHDVSSGNWCFV